MTEFDSYVHVKMTDGLRSQLMAMSLSKNENLSALIRRVLADAVDQHNCNGNKLQAIAGSLDEVLGVMGLIHQGLLDLDNSDKQGTPRAEPYQLAAVMGLAYEKLQRDCWERLAKISQ